jgi:hypothetical protein
MNPFPESAFQPVHLLLQVGYSIRRLYPLTQEHPV